MRAIVKLGSRVTTTHGCGEIVGKDLPDCACWRWIVRLDDGRELCYFQREMQCGCKGSLPLMKNRGGSDGEVGQMPSSRIALS